jgi:hypothetical protein
MLFEYYNNKLCNFIDEYEDEYICFICYKILCDNGNKLLKLNDQIYYLKICSYNEFIYKQCLD